MANENLDEILKKLEIYCLDLIIQQMCNAIDSELFESLSAVQIGKLRSIVKDLV